MNDGKSLTLPDATAEQRHLHQAEFLLSLSDAHRDLWVRRIKKGMKPAIQDRFNGLVAEYAAANPPAVTASSAAINVDGVELERVQPTETQENASQQET